MTPQQRIRDFGLGESVKLIGYLCPENELYIGELHHSGHYLLWKSEKDFHDDRRWAFAVSPCHLVKGKKRAQED